MHELFGVYNNLSLTPRRKPHSYHRSLCLSVRLFVRLSIKTLTLTIAFLILEIVRSYLAYMLLIARPFRWYNEFWTRDLDRDLWPTCESTSTMPITFVPLEIGLSYLECVFYMTRPFLKYNAFWACDPDRDLWPTFDGKEVKRRLRTSRVGVGSKRLRSLAAHGVVFPATGLNLETGQVSRHYEAEISLNVMLNRNHHSNGRGFRRILAPPPPPQSPPPLDLAGDLDFL